MNTLFANAKAKYNEINEIIESDFDEKYFRAGIQLNSLRADRKEFINDYKENAYWDLDIIRDQMIFLQNLLMTAEISILKGLKFSIDELNEFLYSDLLLIQDLREEINPANLKNRGLQKQTNSSIDRLQFAPMYDALINAGVLPDQRNLRKKFCEYLVNIGLYNRVDTTQKLFSQFIEQNDTAKKKDAKNVIETFEKAIAYLKQQYKIP